MDFMMYLEDDSQQNSVKSNRSKKSNHSTKSNRSKKGTHSTKSNRSMKSSRHLTTDDMDFMNYLDDDSPKSKDSHSSKSQKSFQDEVSKAFSNIRADFTVASIVNVELNDDDQRQLAYHSSTSSESDPATVMKIVSNIQCKSSQCKTSGCGGNRSSSYCDPCLGPKQVIGKNPATAINSYGNEEVQYYRAGSDEEDESVLSSVDDDDDVSVLSEDAGAVNGLLSNENLKQVRGKAIDARDTSDKGIRDYVIKQTNRNLSVCKLYHLLF